MIKFIKCVLWIIYTIILFIGGILIGGFMIPYLVIRRHKQNKLKKNESTALTRIANTMEARNAN